MKKDFGERLSIGFILLWDIPTVFNVDSSFQNLFSTLATQFTFHCKHRPVIVTNILCGSGSSFFSHISLVIDLKLRYEHNKK